MERLIGKVATVFVSIACVVAIGGSTGFAGQNLATLPAQTPARPLVELEKTRFAVGEKVFFWIGVDVPGQKVPVPRAHQDSLRVILTRPDGTERIDKGAPLDQRRSACVDEQRVWFHARQIIPGDDPRCFGDESKVEGDHIA